VFARRRLRQGVPNGLEYSLRVKLRFALQTFLVNRPESSSFVDLVTEDVAPNYYCAVPMLCEFATGSICDIDYFPTFGPSIKKEKNERISIEKIAKHLRSSKDITTQKSTRIEIRSKASQLRKKALFLDLKWRESSTLWYR
jgi:hypothetical protein